MGCKPCVVLKRIKVAKEKNEVKAMALAKKDAVPLNDERSFEVIKMALHSLSPSEEGQICYVSEGSNTMDISHSIFPLNHPRLKLDAGSYGAMGVGFGYAIAVHEAYIGVSPRTSSGPSIGRKKAAMEGFEANVPVIVNLIIGSMWRGPIVGACELRVSIRNEGVAIR